jgi:hypothetical protein
MNELIACEELGIGVGLIGVGSTFKTSAADSNFDFVFGIFNSPLML